MISWLRRIDEGTQLLLSCLFWGLRVLKGLSYQEESMGEGFESESTRDLTFSIPGLGRAEVDVNLVDSQRLWKQAAGDQKLSKRGCVDVAMLLRCEPRKYLV